MRKAKSHALAEIRRRKRAGESLATTNVEGEKWGQPFMRRSVTLFGSWTAALLAAGVDLPAGVTSPWSKADTAAILTEIRRRKHARESLRYSKVWAGKWGSPLLKRSETLFGSWRAALLAAGINVAAREPIRAAAGRQKHRPLRRLSGRRHRRNKKKRA